MSPKFSWILAVQKQLFPPQKCLKIGSKRRLMTDDVKWRQFICSAFASDSSHCLVTCFVEFKRDLSDCVKVKRSKWRWLGSCRQRQSFVFAAILKISDSTFSAVCSSVLDLTCQLGHMIGRTLLKANMRFLKMKKGFARFLTSLWRFGYILFAYLRIKNV